MGSADDEGSLPPAAEADDGLGVARVDAELDAFHQQTALFDKGQFLGELADLVDGSPDTRAHVEAEQSPPQGCRFIVVAGPDLGTAWAFREHELVIGRDEDCDLPLSDIAVSRRHARISLQGVAFVVEDLDSNNGTLLNGDRISAPTELVAGDELVIGERTLRFVALNEAPPTDARAPVVSGTEGEAAFEAEAGMSQIDLPAAEEEPVSNEAESGRGRALRRAMIYAAGILVAIGLAGASAYAWRRQLQAAAEAERSVRIRTHFLQSVALVRAERFGDAQRMLASLAEIEPSHPRLQEYREHVQGELRQWDLLQRAAVRFQAGDIAEALEILDRVSPDSAYAKEAARRAQSYEKRRSGDRLGAARRALSQGDLDRALALTSEALELEPGSTTARLLVEDIERARAGRRPPEKKPRSFVVPAGLREVVSTYRQGRLDAAIDAAEASGADGAQEMVARMKTLRTLLGQVERAHRRKAAAALLELGPRALRVDGEVGGGQGIFHDRLVSYFADGLYLQGIEVLQEGNESRAFRLFAGTLEKQPDHPLAQSQLRALEARAQASYYEAQVLEAKDPAGARAQFQRVVDMTRPTNRYHQLARKRLRRR